MPAICGRFVLEDSPPIVLQINRAITVVLVVSESAGTRVVTVVGENSLLYRVKLRMQ